MPDNPDSQPRVAFNIDLSGEALPEIGKIKTGGKGGNTPAKYDHFQVTTLDRDKQTGAFVRDEVVHKAVDQGGYGDKPRELHVMLPYATAMENFAVFRAFYIKASKVQCEGNGKAAAAPGIALWHNDDGGLKQWECKGKDCKYANGEHWRQLEAAGKAVMPSKPVCKLHGNLHCILYRANSRYGGVYIYRTTSFYTIAAIQSSMKAIMAMTRGQIQYIPLILRFQHQNKGGHRVPFVTLEFRGDEIKEPSFVRLIEAAAIVKEITAGAENRLELAGTKRIEQIEAGSAAREMPDPAEVAEFHPEAAGERNIEDAQFTDVDDGADDEERFDLDGALRQYAQALEMINLSHTEAMLRFGRCNSLDELQAAIAAEHDRLQELASPQGDDEAAPSVPPETTAGMPVTGITEDSLTNSSFVHDETPPATVGVHIAGDGVSEGESAVPFSLTPPQHGDPGYADSTGGIDKKPVDKGTQPKATRAALQAPDAHSGKEAMSNADIFIAQLNKAKANKGKRQSKVDF